MLSYPLASIGSMSRISLPKFISAAYENETETELTDFLECSDVRIAPSCLTFADAFEGKIYNKRLVIQNCGASTAFIRICPPNSYAFKIKSLIRGRCLPPGLSIVRYICYTYMCATAVPLTWFPIYINEELVEYKLKVIPSQVMISAIPQKIDFGNINAGHTAAVRMLSLRNEGSKGTRFAIDLGRNEIELLVEPSKGIIQPRSTLTFRVECLGAKEGPFSREFWIKCEKPLRIEIIGDVIHPRLRPFHPNATEDFTLIDFPATYFGARYIKTLVIKNYSAIPTVFCTLVMVSGELVNLVEARNINPDFFSFRITPKEGGILSQEGRIFQFTYNPRKHSKRETENYFFCCLQIVRVPCITVDQIEVSQTASVQNLADFSPSHELDSLSVGSNPTYDDEVLVDVPKHSSLSHQETFLPLTQSTRIMLYGEAETAAIIIRPNSLNLHTVTNNVSVTRELLLQNKSSSLPIIFKYKKVCFVEVNPCLGRLPPSGKLEVSVTVTPTKIGKVALKIGFDLLFYDRPRLSNEEDYVLVGHEEVPLVFDVPATMTKPATKFNTGITPGYVNEVGIFTDDVRFDTKIKMPKSTLMTTVSRKDDDLVAFPNDRPKSLRYRKTSARCRTICAGIPRVTSEKRSNNFELTESKTNFKTETKLHYKNYTREEGSRLRKSRENLKTISADYDISGKNTLLEAKVKKPRCPIRKDYLDKHPYACIPLLPSQLEKIDIFPDDIKLGKIAPNTMVLKTILVKNRNDFPVRIKAKPRKPVISFPEGDHTSAKPHTEIKINFIFHSAVFCGRYNVLLDIIINESHAFTIPITADVIPKSAKLELEEIVFESNECRSRYIDVVNPVNVPVEFRWQIGESCFRIEPQSGMVQGKRHVTCCVTYSPHHIWPSAVEATLYSEKSSSVINVTANLRPPKLLIKNQTVAFTNVPLNLEVEKTVVVRNLGSELVTFSILNPEPMEGMEVTPIEGSFRGCSEQTFCIKAKIPACVKFMCKVQIEFQNTTLIEFKIIGNVVYPDIIIRPNQINLKRVVPNCFDVQEFFLLNKSAAEATVAFPLTDYPEYTILNRAEFDWNNEQIEKIVLNANEERKLYLHFNPIGAGLYSFYLPMVINDLLGPAFLNMSNTLDPMRYMDEMQTDYINLGQGEGIKIPAKLPTAIICSVTSGDVLRFSKLYLKFELHPKRDYSCESASDLKIWNGSKDVSCKFCIRTDELRQPFSLAYVEGKQIQVLDYSIVCSLNPEEYVIFRTEFIPEAPGAYYIKLPIYVKGYQDCSVFNYLQLHGWYPEPLIEPTEKRIALRPAPLKSPVEYRFLVKMSYHRAGCKLQGESDFENLKLSLVDEPELDEEARSVAVVLRCYLKSAQCFDAKVRIFCSCDAECVVETTGCSDNCCLTTYAFIKTCPQQAQMFNTPSQYPEKNKEPYFSQNRSESLKDKTSVHSKSCNETCFPLFPDDSDESDYAKYMRSVLASVEEWVFNQGLYGKTFCKIPPGIVALPQDNKNENKASKKKAGDAKSEKKNKKGDGVLRYVQLLKNLAGNQVLNVIPTGELPETPVERANYFYNIYLTSKEFLCNYGAVLPHVSPEHLLEYKDYLTFKKEIQHIRPDTNPEETTEILNEKTFHRLTKQCWMDLILQTIKVFVLYRIKYSRRESLQDDSARLTESSKQSEASTVASTVNEIKNESRLSFWRSFRNANHRNTGILSESECILLHWLEYNFNEHKEELWGFTSATVNGELPSNKQVLSFETDLNDGLIFMVITYVYCPYLKPYLTDVYLQPKNVAEFYHNACKLLQAWNAIELSFSLTVSQIVKPNSLQMLLLVTYLYEILPNFQPEKVIGLKTGLSTSCTEVVDIQNLSSFPIRYKVIFFNNRKGYFDVSRKVIDLQAKASRKLEVRFQSRRIQLEEAILILNGESFGQTYAKTMTFKLIGEPILSYVTTTVTIPLILYQVLDVDLAIQSPYLVEAVYDTHYSIYEPSDVRYCKIMSWDADRKRKIPKLIIMSEPTQVRFNGDGIGRFLLTVSSFNVTEHSFWFFFTNPDVGDFAIKIVIVPKVEGEVLLTVPVRLPSNFRHSKCVCKDDQLGKTKCPRMLEVCIPSRNDLLWKSVGETLMKVVDEKDKEFWGQYLGTNAGTQICRWLVEASSNECVYDITEIFNKTINYTIEPTNIPSAYNFPSFTSVQNVQSKDAHRIPFHVNNPENLQEFVFTMQSENGVESRHYTISFIVDQEPSNDSNDSNDILSESVITDSE